MFALLESMCKARVICVYDVILTALPSPRSCQLSASGGDIGKGVKGGDVIRSLRLTVVGIWTTHLIIHTCDIPTVSLLPNCVNRTQ